MIDLRRAVWTFTLHPLMNELEVPAASVWLYATAQGVSVIAYALVYPDEPAVRRRLFVVGTGDPSIPDGLLRPLGVASLDGGSLMFHVFEVLS